MKFRIIVYILFNLLAIITLLLAPKSIAYLGFFPYTETLESFSVPQLFKPLGNFDGIQYILIAREYYAAYNIAYFPLYPLIIRYVTNLIPENYLLAGIIISNISFFFAIIMLDKFISVVYNKKISHWFLLFILAYPFSFFFVTVYTESLFLLLFISSLYFFKKEKYVLSGFFGYFAALTKLTGIFLLIPFLTVIFMNYFVNKSLFFKNKKIVIALIGPIFGFLSYTIYLYIYHGDFFAFYNVQPAFGAHRATYIITPLQVLYRYIKILTTADYSYQYIVALQELIVFLTFSTVLFYFLYQVIKTKRFFNNPLELGILLFSIINLFLPVTTGTFTSLGRYSILSISFFIFLALLKRKNIKLFLLVFFALMNMILFAYFVQGYFVA